MKKDTKLLHLEEYFKYLSFIESCKQKKYSEELVLHNHHIIPKFIDYDKTFINKTVLLSVEDHIEAHYLLSKCFDDGSMEQIGNLRSVKLLSKNSLKYVDDLKIIYESILGDLNPSKLDENREKIKEGLLRYFKNNSHFAKNRTYEQLYGDMADKEKEKRRKCTRTPEQYKESAAKAAEKNRGRNVHNSKPIIFQGINYRSINEASAKTGISKYYIKKQL